MSEAVPEIAETIWAVLGMAFASIALWLGVRICNRRERWAKWAAVGLVATPVLYAISSGPMTILAFHTQVSHTTEIQPDGTSRVMSTTETDFGNWFPIAYAPMLWASEQSWGESVFSYWELFPNRRLNREP